MAPYDVASNICQALPAPRAERVKLKSSGLKAKENSFAAELQQRRRGGAGRAEDIRGQGRLASSTVTVGVAKYLETERRSPGRRPVALDINGVEL